MTDPYAESSPPPPAASAPYVQGPYVQGSTTNAGLTLGIVGLVVDFFAAPIGLILSLVARAQSKGAGVKNTPATIGIVLGIIFTAGYVIGGIGIGIGIAGIASECNALGPGVHHVGVTTYTCGE